MQTLRRAGGLVIESVQVLYAVWSIVLYSLGRAVINRREGARAVRGVLFRQIYFTGFEAIPIVSWIALILGLVVVTQSLSILPRLGGERLVGDILVWVVVREVGPLFTSILVVARSGTAIASELGSMRISREITALEVMGIDPMRYLVAPRVTGTALSVFALTFYFEVLAVLGGYLLAGPGRAMTFEAYLRSVLEAMSFLDVWASLLKSAAFGLIIGAVCAYQGLTVEKSITQIPQKTTRAVMGSLGLIFASDAVVTFIFYR